MIIFGILLLFGIFEITQIQLAQQEGKGKWFLPIISFIYSFRLMNDIVKWYLEPLKSDYWKDNPTIIDYVNEIDILDSLICFFIINIPTIIFILTNIIVKKKSRK